MAFLDEYFVPNAPGGAEWSVYFLAKALAAQGHSVRIITPDLSAPEKKEEERKLEEGLKQAGDVRVVRFPFGKKMMGPPRTFPSYVFGNPIFHRKVFNALDTAHREMPFDLVHAQGYDTFNAGRNFSVEHGVPCIATVRDYRALCPISICLHDEDFAPAGCRNGDFQKCLKKYSAQYGLTFTVSSKIRHDIRRRMEWINSRKNGDALKNMSGAIFVSERIGEIYRRAQLTPRIWESIPNLPPLEETHAEPTVFQEKHGLEGKRILAFVGRYSLGKGARVLCAAMSIVKSKYPDAVCAVAGNREYSESAENVVFLGSLSRTDLGSLYASAESVVVPSRWQEPFSRVVLEAMQAGVPVIASDSGGNSEMITNGVNGILVPRNNPEELAAAISTMLAFDDARRKKMGEAARKICREKFSEESITRRIVTFYQRMIDQSDKAGKGSAF